MRMCLHVPSMKLGCLGINAVLKCAAALAVLIGAEKWAAGAEPEGCLAS